MIPLYFVAAKLVYYIGLFFGFNTLSNYLEAEISPHVHNEFRKHVGALVVLKIQDKASVDLQAINWEFEKVTE